MTRTALATFLLGILSLASSTSAQPLFQAIYNNYSYIQPGMPNYGIAQGSVFVILRGGDSDLAESIASQGVPLQTSLAGVGITVTVGGVTTQAIPYYVSPSQITALLPSKTPLGNGLVKVFSGGNIRTTDAITVVQSAFGLATNPTPESFGVVMAAVAQNASEGSQLLSPTNAANPGEYLTLWGSGLGPVSGDETIYQTQTTLANIPVEVDIGGVNATVTYYGRSIYPGVDQINVIVPAGVSGCNVSVVVTAGGVPSNFATIPVATSGRLCSDPGLVPVTPSEYQTLLSRSDVGLGAISLTTFTNIGGSAGSDTSDSAYATFQEFSANQFGYTGFFQQPSIGSCLVRYDVNREPPLPPPPLISSSSPLNAGGQIHVNGPNGSLSLPRVLGTGSYTEPFGTSPAIVPSTGGTFTFDNGSGGTDVGAFTASLSGSLTTPLVWTNRSAITAVERAKGQSITWTGGSPGSYVSIFGYSSFAVGAPEGGNTFLYAYFTCSAPVSDGQFTVPATVLESLPATISVPLVPNGPLLPSGYLYVASGTIQRFSAPGLDLGLLFFGAGSGISVPLK